MQKELLYQIALTRIANIGAVNAKALVNHFGSEEVVFMLQKGS